MQIAIIRRSDAVTDTDVAFWASAVNDQLLECCAAWSIDPVVVSFYARDGVPPEARVMSIVNDVGAAGVKGYHDEWAGTITAQVQANGAKTSVVISHEALEMTVDPNCNRWRTMPDGVRSTALEVCDAVQWDTYRAEATILGETRDVELSDFLLPSWFDVRGVYPFDHRGQVSAPFGVRSGGYLIVKDDNGNVSNVFASGMPLGFERKLVNPVSRTLRRLGGR